MQEDEEPGKANDPAENQTGNFSRNKETTPRSEDPLELGEIPQSDPRAYSAAATSDPSKEASVDPLQLDSDQGEETDEGDSSSSLPTNPFKNLRGRK